MEEQRDLLLMSSDNIVMRINFDLSIFEVVNERLLPWTIRGKLRKVISFDEVKTRYDDTQRQIAIGKNKEAIMSWLANRTLPLSRKNAKWVYNLLKLEQLNSEYEKAKVALECRAVSVIDNYWVKLDGDPVRWKDVNIRHVSLNEIIAQVALHGSSLTLQGSLNTPELTTHGAYAKGWKRENGDLWLYKLGSKDPTESKIEVMCSKLLDKLPVEHLEYVAGESMGIYACKCKCMATDNLSILHGMDFYTYCNVNGLDANDEMMRIDSESIYKMWIVDYLISNRDRHGQNWGFYYEPESMTILRCHPLYDHNNAFANEYMDNPDAPYQFLDMSTREAAKKAISKVDFYFKEPITRGDFMTSKQYESFMSRANELGIKVRIADPLIDAATSASV